MSYSDFPTDDDVSIYNPDEIFVERHENDITFGKNKTPDTEFIFDNFFERVGYHEKEAPIWLSIISERCMFS